ncbi:hypothetical protein ZIOFF_022301 [Zingiber officinale]|uniref:Uncharacterized protein n=1 Tax=Zingiber officinale TaxID=94328 RepID=A0A8J5H9C4_ZINOF|nr:hypothetical protein ZIOFF_022301 [Zingiber officinale]
MPGIQHLKLGKLFVVSEEQYGELKSLLCLDQLQHSQPQKSRFYHTCRLSHHCDDNCVLDFDLCPFCEKYKLVYDCPSESCQVQGPKGCRACDVCISRQSLGLRTSSRSDHPFCKTIDNLKHNVILIHGYAGGDGGEGSRKVCKHKKDKREVTDMKNQLESMT